MENISVAHDGLLTICTGASRKTKIWKQKQISWSDLIQRLSNTKRTAETQEQYFRLGKERQDEIKDVGGFVGGELRNGRRTALTVINRQIITLDADFAEKNFWEKIISKFDNAACVYSTHKHTPENPRLRFVIPLDRKVSPDEYQAISRKIAENFGIDNFDDTTYQPHRLMYFPSTSSDAEFFFKFQDGEFLSADKILASYDDWQNVSTWARSSRSKNLIQHEIKKAEDPLKKNGLIGAFCRSYTIQEVISKFLPDVYEEVNSDRFTFKGGTSSGGAIVYENKFLYSFHATDPCSLILCNAFDLVRIHKFGELDEGKEKKDFTSLPSYSKMLELCSKDEKVKILLTEEAMKDFDDLGDEKNFDWAKNLSRNSKTGKILSTRDNIQIILENDPQLKNSFGYDLFSQRTAILSPLFWRNKDDSSEYWNESDDAQLRHYLETYYNIDNKSKIDDAISNVASNHSFHKVKNYLRGLIWDGVPRMDKIFVKYLGADDSEYVRAVTRKSLIAAVARVMQPGIKFDNMIVLEGAQGIGKSFLLSKLGKDWFSDSLVDLRNKDAFESLRGYWILEMAEMLTAKKSDSETMKFFISKQRDSFRVAYGRRTEDFPRQCIFFGTTNNKFFLKDRTGNRRFFPITCSFEKREKNIFHEKNIDAEIDQIWAEAFFSYQQGESIWIGYEMEKIAKKIQEQHTEENPLTGPIEEFLNKKIPADWYERDLQKRIEFIRNNGDFDEEIQKTFERKKICTAEIFVEMLGGELKRLDPLESRKITETLLNLSDWMPSDEKLFFGSAYGKQKGFIRKEKIFSEEDLDDLPF